MIQPCLAAVLAAHDAALIMNNQGNFNMGFGDQLKREIKYSIFFERISCIYLLCKKVNWCAYQLPAVLLSMSVERNHSRRPINIMVLI